MSLTRKEKPLVSIIVVTYNSSPYVVETLESAKNQSYKNIELIVTDDCSEDGTVKICSSWLESNKNRFARIELLTSEINTGTSSNINRGIAAAKGRFIKETAGDDILLKNCVADNVEFCLQNNAFFVFSDMIYFRKNEFNEYENMEIEDSVKRIQSLYVEFSKLDFEGQTRFYSRNPIFLNSPTWFYEKSKIPFLDEDFRLVEDQPLIFRYLATEEKLHYLNKLTVRYRRYDQSKNSSKYFSYFDDYIHCYGKYRKNNLKRSSLIDLSFIIHYYIKIYFGLWSRKNLFGRVLLYPFKKINPVNLFNVSPSVGLAHFRVKEIIQ